MKCIKRMNWHESIAMNDLKWRNWNELKWRNWNAWIETHELKRMNWNAWIKTLELVWMNWDEGIDMKELTRVNLNEWIDMKEFTWRNWNAWLETHELTWMNWNTWLDTSELKWVAWHDWLEMKELKRMNGTKWMKWMNSNDRIDMNEVKRMNWNGWIKMNVCLEKVVQTRQFFSIFMWNRALVTVACTFCRPHLQKVVWARQFLTSLCDQLLDDDVVDRWNEALATAAHTHFVDLMVDLIFKKWSDVSFFFAIFMWNLALTTVPCAFCRPHDQKV